MSKTFINQVQLARRWHLSPRILERWRWEGIGPHPDLSESQKKNVALDYGMHGGRTKIKVRKALLYYALRILGLDTEPSAREPQDQQIILLNKAEVLQ